MYVGDVGFRNQRKQHSIAVRHRTVIHYVAEDLFDLVDLPGEGEVTTHVSLSKADRLPDPVLGVKDLSSAFPCRFRTG